MPPDTSNTCWYRNIYTCKRSSIVCEIPVRDPLENNTFFIVEFLIYKTSYKTRELISKHNSKGNEGIEKFRPISKLCRQMKG